MLEDAEYDLIRETEHEWIFESIQTLFVLPRINFNHPVTEGANCADQVNLAEGERRLRLMTDVKVAHRYLGIPARKQLAGLLPNSWTTLGFLSRKAIRDLALKWPRQEKAR
jgi:hypothetical protein